jgi:hypothetical protein
MPGDGILGIDQTLQLDFVIIWLNMDPKKALTWRNLNMIGGLCKTLYKKKVEERGLNSAGSG